MNWNEEMVKEYTKKYPISDELRRQIDDLILNWKRGGEGYGTTYTALALQAHIDSIHARRSEENKRKEAQYQEKEEQYCSETLEE